MNDATKFQALIRPARAIAGTLQLPGDKSISHRYAMLAAIAEGQTKLENYSSGADCASTLACVGALGAKVTRTGSSVTVEGAGPVLRDPKHPLDCGNSGSTMRMLSGILAGQPFATELIGDESLSRRPMRRIMEPLGQMGATFEAQDGHAPVRIRGGKLHSIEYKMQVASAQVKSSVLFAGLYADGQTVVEEPVRTRDHSELALRAFGAEVETGRSRNGDGSAAGYFGRIRGGQKLRAIEAAIPADISTAAFFLCAAALLPGSDLWFENLLLNPTRAALLDVMVALGLKVEVVNAEERHGEIAGAVHVQYGRLLGLELSGAMSAALIDELPVLAAIAPYTEKGVEIRDARELRVKESDRIAAVAANLRAMGATVEELEDGLRVPGGQRLQGAEVDSFGDHRIAMAFAIAALRAEGETLIRGADAARISFPEFFTTLESLVQR
jgi:3-phosphoshikimate 1-carboxyvinyltransferase